MLQIEQLYAMTEGRTILKGVDLTVRPGEIHAIMGPNGAGKSTLAKVLAGDPAYETTGKIHFQGQDVCELDPEERARLGIFLGFQYPIEISGISNLRFLHAAHNAMQKVKGAVSLTEEQFEQLLDQKIALLNMRYEFKMRGVNEGFSGGEKKRNEILQMAVLDPKLAILDETDSGLDIDALKAVAEGILQLSNADNAILLITHYQRLLDYIKPQYVHVMLEGKIVESGGPDLARKLEQQGYDWLVELKIKEGGP
jgi:Fe-S cluster assembly ATP-binding protein